MKNNIKIRFVIIFIGGFFLLFDRFLKYQALYVWQHPVLINKFLGWQPFLNQGAAFGLPLPNWLIIALTTPIIVLLLFLLIKKRNNHVYFLSLMLIFAGAVSNLLDRLYYNQVIDYLMLTTGIVNTADILIVLGLLIYCLVNIKIKNNQTP